MQQNAPPAKHSHTGRNIALGLGALVAGLVGVDMLMDGNDDNSGNSSSHAHHSSSSGCGNSGGSSSYGNDSSSAAYGNNNDYTAQNYSGNVGGGGGAFDPNVALAAEDAQAEVNLSTVAGIDSVSSAT